MEDDHPAVRKGLFRLEDDHPAVRKGLFRLEDDHPAARKGLFRLEDDHPAARKALFRLEDDHPAVRKGLFRLEDDHPAVRKGLFRLEDDHPAVRKGLFRLEDGELPVMVLRSDRVYSTIRPCWIVFLPVVGLVNSRGESGFTRLNGEPGTLVLTLIREACFILCMRDSSKVLTVAVAVGLLVLGVALPGSGQTFTSAEEVADHFKWQLEQRILNIEQQLGIKVDIDLDDIDTTKAGSSAASMEKVNRKLKELEAIAYGSWRSNPLVGEERKLMTSPFMMSESQSRNMVTAEVAGSKITASNLGVILDVSGSMSPYLEALREEILKSYPKAHFIEITGCHLGGEGPYRAFYSMPGMAENPFEPKQFHEKITSDMINSFQAVSFDTLSAFLGLVENRNVDSVFWFCDLQDGMTPEAIETIEKMLAVHGTQIYVTSLGEDAPQDFKTAVESKDGHVVIKDGKDLRRK